MESLRKVEQSIDDIKPLLQQRLGKQVAFQISTSETETQDIFTWQVEWVEEVQKVLEMDAGWGLKGFWEMVLHNLQVGRVSLKSGCNKVCVLIHVFLPEQNPPAPPEQRPTNAYIVSQIVPIVQAFKTRLEWQVLRNVRAVVQQVEVELERMANDSL